MKTPAPKAAKKAFKIGLDLHGVIDARPEFFSALTHAFVDAGHEIHILTGSHMTEELQKVKDLGIAYTHFFSIADHHKAAGTEMIYDEKGNPHLDPYLWDKTKAEYCKEMDIDLHIDDSDIYSYFFKTPYSRFYSKDSHRNSKIHIGSLRIAPAAAAPRRKAKKGAR